MSTRDVTFRFDVMTRDVEEFQRHAEQAARLKKFGRVALNVSTLAEATPYDLPPGNGAWHEYLMWHASLIKFFPHPKIAPHLPKGHAERNLELLLAQAGILERLGLEASFYGHEPFFLPESFFEEHPRLRGPRVDHPRRSVREEFAPCTDLPEVREMYEWMMAEFKHRVPILTGFTFRVNDAGSGLCWNSALYPGRNGPAHCEAFDPGVRVQKFVEALHRGAEKGGGRIRIAFNGNFYNNETYTIVPKLPPDTCMEKKKDDSLVLHSMEQDPVRGIVNPLALLRKAERLQDPDLRTFVVRVLSCNYAASDDPRTTARCVDILEDCLARPLRGPKAKFDRLHELCARWAGKASADELFGACLALDEAAGLVAAAQAVAVPRVCGATLRHLTRPLLIRPEVLSREEESYFLPFVFNIREGEARTDFLDAHGGRFDLDPVVRRVWPQLAAVARRFEVLQDAPDAAWLGRLARSVRIWSGILRSACNFEAAQRLRERNAALLAGAERIPGKTETPTGDSDNLPWNGILRDEYENTAELLALLQAGGADSLCLAARPEEECAFALGPDVTGALTRKLKLMRAHWRDAEKYLASPHM